MVGPAGLRRLYHRATLPRNALGLRDFDQSLPCGKIVVFRFVKLHKRRGTIMSRSVNGEAARIRAQDDRLFAETMRGHWRPRGGSVWHPPTDVYETDDSVVVTMEIAGLEAGEYRLTLANRRLAVRGRRTGPTGRLVYHQMEIRYGEFRIEVSLPWPLRDGSEEIEATYADGFLQVVLQKAEPLRVPVTSGSRDADGGK